MEYQPEHRKRTLHDRLSPGIDLIWAVPAFFLLWLVIGIGGAFALKLALTVIHAILSVVA